jgi:hypothetical protein
MGVLSPIQSLAVRPETVAECYHQPAHSFSSDSVALPAQHLGQLANGLARPLHSTNRIPSGFIFQQLPQSNQQARILLSPTRRPPPISRTRPRSRTGSPCVTSLRPRQMVFRLSPVTTITRCTPPRPHCIASTSANLRWLFSFRPAITRLIARCSRDNALFGYRWHSSHSHICPESLVLLAIFAHCFSASMSRLVPKSLMQNRQVIYGQILRVHPCSTTVSLRAPDDMLRYQAQGVPLVPKQYAPQQYCLQEVGRVQVSTTRPINGAQFARQRQVLTCLAQ